MAKTMIASEGMTDGQIDTLANQIRDAARKHCDEVGKDAAQRALGVDNLGMRMFTVFRELAEKLSGPIIRHVKVNRSLTPAEAIKATGRVPWYIDEEILAEMPRDGFEEGNVEVFELDYDPTPEQLDRELDARGLRPDPYALCQAMADDPAFADERPVATQWRDKRDRACYAYFGRNGSGRDVYVGRSGGGWGRDYRFAGVRNK